MSLRLYLAGPDVFRPQPVAHGDALKALCAAYGFIGLYPLDNTVAPQADGPATAAEIYRQNIALLDSADAVLANVADFRGHEPDSGTCFEIGYAIARGKDVWCYNVPIAPLVAQVPNVDGSDADGWTVEDFGLPRNLMLACSGRLVAGNARACLERMRAHYA
ncbi:MULTISPECIES: nucleoside 2-deoxyribosyltransferase [Ralstonia solanacearum species complex]|uniref:nucleoside 2-deoxyribosyltransferase n=1 Tax=Ralstonia solanacearum species complex TaxID=3116862 RepID=UPI00078EC16C|nr:nucleoside 2-deoxyribosyltransferase [Ralstonia solanacearum]BEU72900.1 nucleoside 2-deoxyribosyltransferase [Ralstonia pseudosolanacearum]AMP38326.1 nucleoside 2-deoxyribosyltransferase [Ralstonia solanacearum]AXV77726.1 nucleoside 2-deoxyribosyltransferase [Ralstonia solanacearum]AXV87153.1 nucleoside 2-deoxyribosyltransferase [Ralstonia solanacearum]AXV91750.1 nucleoside 2-deoxyribosyltransferase [Ralstonia solanacearum]